MGNHVTYEERLERIKRVLELVSSGMSYRECADYLSENEFKISHVTVRDYVNRAEELNLKLYNESIKVIKNNKSKTINDEEVKTRAKKVCELLKLGYTIEEIAKALNSTPWTVYRDFDRIQTIEEEELNKMGITQNDINEIKENLTEKSLNNLRNRKTS